MIQYNQFTLVNRFIIYTHRFTIYTLTHHWLCSCSRHQKLHICSNCRDGVRSAWFYSGSFTQLHWARLIRYLVGAHICGAHIGSTPEAGTPRRHPGETSAFRSGQSWRLETTAGILLLCVRACVAAATCQGNLQPSRGIHRTEFKHNQPPA